MTEKQYPGTGHVVHCGAGLGSETYGQAPRYHTTATNLGKAMMLAATQPDQPTDSNAIPRPDMYNMYPASWGGED